MLWSGRNNDQREVATLRQKVDTMSLQQQGLTANLNRYKEEAEMAAQPGMLPVAMRSMQPGHSMAATFYWDKAKSEAYVSVQKLPPPPEGMQYQLWAIVDGTPVSIGMLETDVTVNGGMQKVPAAVPAGQAFAVSLEKAGGSLTPTPDKIFLMGKTPV
jgi:anti-sigma-K factor RskA